MSGTGHAEPVDPQPILLSLGWFLQAAEPNYYDVSLVLSADLLSWMVDAAIARVDQFGTGGYAIRSGSRVIEVKVQRAMSLTVQRQLAARAKPEPPV